LPPLSWGVPCKHLTSLPHISSKALLEFTNYLQTYVVSFSFIAAIYIRPRSVRAVYVRPCLTSFCVRSNGTSATCTAVRSTATIAKPLSLACRDSSCPLLHTRIHRIVLLGKSVEGTAERRKVERGADINLGSTEAM
jgi:hypothetical protein